MTCLRIIGSLEYPNTNKKEELIFPVSKEALISVMVWSAIWQEGRSVVHIIDELGEEKEITAAVYETVLGTFLLSIY